MTTERARNSWSLRFSHSNKVDGKLFWLRRERVDDRYFIRRTTLMRIFGIFTVEFVRSVNKDICYQEKSDV